MGNEYMVIQNKSTGRKMLVDRASMKRLIAKGNHVVVGGSEAIAQMKKEKREHIRDTVVSNELKRIKLEEEQAQQEQAQANKIIMIPK